MTTPSEWPNPRTDFDEFFRKVVEPRILDYAATRESVRSKVVLGRRLKWFANAILIAGAAMAFIGENMDDDGPLELAGFGVLFAGVVTRGIIGYIFGRHEKRLSGSARSVAVTPIAKSLGLTVVNENTRLPDGYDPILPTYHASEVDDVVRGEMGGRRIEFRDLVLTVSRNKSTRTVFSGLIGQIEGATGLSGKIAVIPDSSGVSEFFSDLFASRAKVDFPEDEWFETIFTVRADNPEEARSRIDQTVRTAFRTMHHNNRSNRTGFLLAPDCLRFSISDGSDLMEIGDALEINDFRKLTRRMVEEMSELETLVKALEPVFAAGEKKAPPISRPESST